MLGSTAITIGNFDGVHLGHAQLIQTARHAVGPDGRVVAITFDPHPMTILQPTLPSMRLSTLGQRQDWLAELGADDVVAVHPTVEFLRQPPEQFVARLVEQHAPSVIVEGDDFRFGRERSGSVDTLRQLQKEFGYECVVMAPVTAPLSDHVIVRASSTMIRRLLGHGRVRDAAALLGRPYTLRCPVVCGDQRGGPELGVATANLDHGEFLLPADGVYCGMATRPDGRAFPAAISVGTKPTYGNNPRVCEAHLLDYHGEGGEYGWEISLQFHDWMRDQIAFEREDLLLAQIERDIAQTRYASGAKHPRALTTGA